jgi:hypothetical protein
MKPTARAMALLLAASAAALAQEPEDALARRVSLDLEEVEVVSAFRSLEHSLGLAVEVDPRVDARVTIRVQGVSVRTALTAICESVGCRWELRRGTPPAVTVAPAPAPPAAPAGRLDSDVSLDLKAAAAADVLRSFAEILGVELESDPGLAARPVTAALRSVSVRDALDRVCAAIACRWRLVDGDSPVLRVETAD